MIVDCAAVCEHGRPCTNHPRRKHDPVEHHSDWPGGVMHAWSILPPDQSWPTDGACMLIDVGQDGTVTFEVGP